MDEGPLSARIIEAYDGLSTQLQAAARFVLERPRDVALLSMREQARQAGLQPATMTRFAQHLGLEGYDAVRALYADAMRGTAGQAGTRPQRPPLKGDRALAADMLAASARQLEGLTAPESLDTLAAAAKAVGKARRIYVLGQRTCFPVAWHMHHALRAIGRKAHLLDAPGATGADVLVTSDGDDVVLAVSLAPHTRQATDVVALASGRGVPVIAVTDSAVSPLARVARHVVLVPTQSLSVLPTIGPALAAAESLVALVAARTGDKALAAARRAQAHAAALDANAAPAPAPRSPARPTRHERGS